MKPSPAPNPVKPHSPVVSLYLLLTLFFLFFTCPVSAQEERYWTTKDGIKHRGSLMFMSTKNVTIKGPAGTISLPLSKLSDEDLLFIKRSKSNTKKLQNPGIPMSKLPPGFSRSRIPPSTNPATATTPSTATIKVPTPSLRPSASPTSSAKWPAKVKTTFSPADIKTISETKKEGYIYRSPHFEFRSPFRLPHRAVREFSLIFESTYDLANAMPIDLQATPGGNGFYITELYATKEDYFNAGGPSGSAGAFFPSSGKILVPLTSLGIKRSQNNIRVNRGAAGNTLIHEVTHQVMMRWLPLIPIWMGEGFAEVTSAMPYEAGLFRLSRMSKSVRESTGSGPGAGRSFEMVPVLQLMSMSPQSWSAAVADREGQQNYRSASILLYYFLRLDGQKKGERLKAYINARLKGEADGNAQQKYLLDGRSYEQLQKDVARAWREEGLKITYSK
ncbi:MAG: hypothetical protein QM496_14215 [Verrucomicrobiota bacterium]